MPRAPRSPLAVEVHWVVDPTTVRPKFPKARHMFKDTVGLFLNGREAPGKRIAFVFLGPIYNDAKAVFGPKVPEEYLMKQVIDTNVHEVLHGFIVSGAHRSYKRWDRRVHFAMARLMWWTGMDPSW